MPHRVYEVKGDGPTIVFLHPATVSPERTAALIGPVPGFNMLYPESNAGMRWDHLGLSDAPYVKSLGGDFIAGFSSGAFMAYRMAFRERQYKGMLANAGGMIQNYASNPWPYPCRALLCNGTLDPRITYTGSPGTLGAVASAQAIAGFHGITTSTRTQVPNSTGDACTAYVDNWRDMVELYTVTNGGHTWPGAKNNLPLGLTSMDFSLTRVMADFFAERLARAA